jgi:hypothetical protein
MPLTQPEVTRALEIARAMAAAGVPIFVAAPCAGDACTAECHRRHGAAGVKAGYHLPARWESTVAVPEVVNTWSPGMALCAVGGHVCDFLDVDPRNGGLASSEQLWQAGHWPTCYSTAHTPSGGTHSIIQPLGRGKGELVAGVDLQGGRPDGTGRGFVFIAPTVRRSKVDGVARPYRWGVEPDLALLAQCRGEQSGAALAKLMPEKLTKVKPRLESADALLGIGVEQHTVGSAYRTINTKAAEVTGHITSRGWGGFRDTLNGAAYTLGAYVGSGFMTEEQATRVLTGAITAAGVPTIYDENLRTIEVGISDGAKHPIAVVVERTQRPFDATGQASGSQNLPEGFWAARAAHKHIRDAAHCRARSADAVFGVVLARLSSMVDGSVRVDTGIGSPTALNTYSILLGTAAAGKSTAAALARELFPPLFDNDSMEHPLGSGQGVADAFGAVHEGVWQQNAGKAFFYSDEGASLLASAKQRESTTLATIRQAWTGGMFGMKNATAERNRRVVNYSMGMWVGLQPTHAAELFSDTNVDDGTLQRFLWFATADEQIPEGRPVDSSVTPLPLDLGNVWSQQPVRLPEQIKDQIWANEVAVARGKVVPDPGQRHGQLKRIRVACLLAILDGRRDVDFEDWDLAGVVVATSEAVAGSVRLASVERAARAEEAAAAKRHRAADADEHHAERKTQDKINKMVEAVVARVAEKPGTARATLVRNYSDRVLADAAIAQAESRGLIESRPGVKHGHTLWLPNAT